MRKTVLNRALDIAAEIMQVDGLCAVDDGKCWKTGRSAITCAQCIKNWLIEKARYELRRERKL